MSTFLKRLQRGLARQGLQLLSSAQELFNSRVKAGIYNLAADIKSSEWGTDRGGLKAREWFKSTIEADKDYKFSGIMEAGKLYSFRYPNPKTRETLDYFDTDPLILCLGHYISKDREIIELGINLHFLPLKVRQQVLITIFNIFSQKYKGQMYRKKQKAVFLQWRQIAAPLIPYGAAFAFRSYIPKRRVQTFEMRYEDWSKAVFLQSRAYRGTSLDEISMMWRKFVMNKSLNQVSQGRFEEIISRSI